MIKQDIRLTGKTPGSPAILNMFPRETGACETIIVTSESLKTFVFRPHYTVAWNVSRLSPEAWVGGRGDDWHFRLSTLIRHTPFSWYPLWKAFSKTSVFRHKIPVFHRFSVDGKPKRIHKYPFSNENGLVWKGPETRKRKPYTIANFVRKCRSSSQWEAVKTSLVLSITSCKRRFFAIMEGSD